MIAQQYDYATTHHSADKSATPLPTERILVAQQKNRRLESRLFELGYQDSNLE